jgi:hypothetical protein
VYVHVHLLGVSVSSPSSFSVVCQPWFGCSWFWFWFCLCCCAVLSCGTWTRTSRSRCTVDAR